MVSMDNRYTTFGLRRSSFSAWCAAALMALAAVLRIVYYAVCGANGIPTVGSVWLLAVLPTVAAVLFVLNLLIRGRNKLYKTSFSVLLGAGFFVARIFYLLGEDGSAVKSPWHAALCCVLYFAAWLIWDLTVNGARIKTKLPAILVYSLPIVYHLAIEDIPHWVRNGTSLLEMLPELSVLLIMSALLTASVGLQKFTSPVYRPRRGDRCDGRLVRGNPPLNGVASYIMPSRNGAATYFRDSFECTGAEEYIRQKREQGLDGFGLMHVIAAAYVRVISQKPELNRFISGQKIFTRDGEIELAMAVKKDMTSDSPETIIKVVFSPSDTAEDVYRKYDEQVRLAKDTPLDSSFDKVAWIINIVPGVLKKFGLWIIRVLDYFGCLPRALLRLSPFHGSIFITSLGSLGIPPVCHHLYDFGNIPVFLAFGARRHENELQRDGSIAKRHYLDYTVVSDERITDGFYYASGLKLVRRYLSNPTRLDEKPENIVEDIY